MTERKWETGYIKELSEVKTIGELKKAIKDYPDDTGFSFRNQPTQQLHELKHGETIYVVFQ